MSWLWNARTRAAATLSSSLAGIVVALLIPYLSSEDSFQLQRYEYLIVLIVLSVSLNVITGFAGQLSLSSSAVFMVSAYVVGILINDHPKSVGLWWGCLVGVVVGVALGAVVALPALRVGGFYLAMITLFVALLVPVVVGNLKITGGQPGISLISNPGFTQSYSAVPLYDIFVLLALAAILASAAVLHSRLGRRFVLLRTSQELAASIGVSGHWTKIVAFMIGSGLSGLAGAMYVYSQQLINPQSITATTAFYLVAACLIGGLGRVVGPVIGGLLVFGFAVLLTSLDQYQGVIFGVALALFVIAAPEGIVGVAGTALGRLRARRLRAQDAPTGEPAGQAAMHVPADAKSRAETPDPAQVAAAVPPQRQRDDADDVARLSLRGVGRSFGGVSAAEAIDLTVSAGTVHGLVGSNGSGKTTVLNLICGYYRLDAGEIAIGDRSIGGWPPHRIARSGIARTFQTPTLVAGASVVDNVLPAAEAAARSSSLASVLRLPTARRALRQARGQAERILSQLDLLAWRDVVAESLPHGTRRLTEVARALALRPTFLLLDEPAAGLSPGELAALAAVIRQAADSGVGVLLIEHNIPFVLEVADELTVLHRGRLLASGPPSMLQDRSISSVFLGSDADAIISEAAK